MVQPSIRSWLFLWVAMNRYWHCQAWERLEKKMRGQYQYRSDSNPNVLNYPVMDSIAMRELRILRVPSIEMTIGVCEDDLLRRRSGE